MSAIRGGESVKPSRVLCLGEALVDLICEKPVRGMDGVDRFVPHFGGATANVAVLAARAGASVALAGGAGEDHWGEWLRDRLEAEGVDSSLFVLVPGARTTIALVTIDPAGAATYDTYRGVCATIVDALDGRLEAAVRDSAALLLSSNTLVNPEERALTMRAREIARELERPIVFDPNLRLSRWRSRADAAASANACVPGALLVRCNEAEAALMTGEHDVERSALALLKGGAEMVIITLGADGAILRGRHRVDVPGVPARAISSVGAGDALTGVLLAKLALSGFYPSAVAASLRDAVAEAARACERWGALE